EVARLGRGPVAAQAETGQVVPQRLRRCLWHLTGEVVHGGEREIERLGLVLGKVADPQLAVPSAIALLGLKLAREQAGESRLAVTVGPQERDAVVHVEPEIETPQDR